MDRTRNGHKAPNRSNLVVIGLASLRHLAAQRTLPGTSWTVLRHVCLGLGGHYQDSATAHFQSIPLRSDRPGRCNKTLNCNWEEHPQFTSKQASKQANFGSIEGSYASGGVGGDVIRCHAVAATVVRADRPAAPRTIQSVVGPVAALHRCPTT